ncbi:MAG: 50S ribosomal protein L1 [Chloroflexi bacterium]|nr:50S ribosomal protein L1 [Chloroflexota bacterium]HCU73284.1 50S ribosomal protein L1 [Chloroflexota bacterium]
MTRHGKRYRQASGAVPKNVQHGLEDAVELLVELPKAKFDEAVELHARLGVDPAHADQQVRGTLLLPHGTGRSTRVIVFASGDRAQEARDAGADEVGTDDLAKKIQGGWVEFDAAVATPDNMRIIGPLGRILGPRGLMPNARAGTVTDDVARVVEELKAGRVEFRVDRLANLHIVVGRVSMGRDALLENLTSVVEAVSNARPSVVKGTYVHSLSICSSMGPGIPLDPQAVSVRSAVSTA